MSPGTWFSRPASPTLPGGDRFPWWNPFRSPSELLALEYHRIGSWQPGETDPSRQSASLEEFDQQLRELKQSCDVIAPEDLESLHQQQPRGRFVLVTLDGGYRDAWRLAFPILRTYQIRAVFSVSTDYIDHPRIAWWDELAWMLEHRQVNQLAASLWFPAGLPLALDTPASAMRPLKQRFLCLASDHHELLLDWLGQMLGCGRCPAELSRELWMTWEMIRELDRAGMTIASQTASQPLLQRLSLHEQDREIRQSAQRLREELGHPVQTFAFPWSEACWFNDAARLSLERHGFRWAFSQSGDTVRLSDLDPLNIPRLRIGQPIQAASDLMRTS